MQPENLIQNFSTHLKNIIANSISLAGSLNYKTVTPVHLFFTAIEETGSVASEILYRTQIDAKKIIAYIEASAPRAGSDKKLPELNLKAKQALEKAMLIAYEKNHKYIGSEHLLYGLLQTRDSDLISILKNNNVKLPVLTRELEAILQSASHFPDMENVREVIDELQDFGIRPLGHLPPLPGLGPTRGRPNQRDELSLFTTNLTDKKIADKFDPVIGREKEIHRLINVLSRRAKNNPVLVGEPGVGKTAIVEGLAKKIVAGEVPDILKRKKILSLDLTLLIAGTIYRGEFEARLKQIIDEVAAKPDYILFIDEIHNIIGAGSNQGTMDAANILKPALSRGLLRCIGATTIDEYKKHITADPALSRRFQQINIEESSPAETEQILRGLKKYYENFHNVIITDEAITAAVALSTKFIHNNFLPDKAIDLIDEASARVRAERRSTPLQKKLYEAQKALEQTQKDKAEAIKNESFDLACAEKDKEKNLSAKLNLLQKQAEIARPPARQRVDQTEVAEIVRAKTNIPLDVLLSNEWEHLNRLPENLKNHIIGQDAVIDQITRSLNQAYLKLSDKKRPLASFLFVGPSGVGKTETAKVLARELYMSEHALIKLDMSEYAEAHSISRLLGSPAGYVGYRERNHFTDELHKRPYAVLLFDEFDRAHRQVQKLLLQILDEGEISDSQGKKIHLHNSIVILTTNVGAEFYKSSGIGFGQNKTHSQKLDKDTETSVQTKLKEEFGADLLARIQTTCLFSPLNRAVAEKIIDKNLQLISRQLREKQGISIVAETATLSDLARTVFSEDAGMRHAEKIIQDQLYDLIVEILRERGKQKKEYTLIKANNAYKLV